MAVPGAGDIAHVYLLDLGPDLAHEEVEFITFDDATSQLLVVKGSHVFAYDISNGPAGDSSLRWMYPLQEGPRVIALRPSLDNRMLAVQRSAAMLELVDLASGLCFVHSIHKGRGDILEFFFTDAPETDMVVVTSRAVEFNQYAARRQGLRCRERVRCSNAWAKYTHETRMVMVGSSAAPGSALAAWQLASHGITQLPLFELQGPLPASAAVRQFLPGQTPYQQQLLPAAAHPAGITPVRPGCAAAAAVAGGGAAAADFTAAVQQQHVSAGSGGSHKNLSPERLWLLKIYGRVYLAHADIASNQLELYRFYTDTIILQHVYELFAPTMQLSVVDNTLVVHYPDIAVIMLVDVALPQSGQLAHPLPLRRLQLLPPALAAAVSEEQRDIIDTTAQQQGMASDSSSSSSTRQGAGTISRTGSRALVTAGSSSNISVGAGSTVAAVAAGDVYEASEVQHSSTWRYYMPGYILDMATKSIGRLQLDLQAIADSASDWPTLVGFLSRRRALAASMPLAVEPRVLLMHVARSVLTERLPLAVVRLVFDRLLQAYADALARAAGSAVASTAAAAAGGPAVAAVTRPPLLSVPAVTVITPHDLARDLFQWVHDEEVVDALYLQAAVSEFCAAADAVGVAPPAYLQLLAVDLLLQQEQHYQAVQLLYCQPGVGSSQLAQHLLEVASSREGAAAAGVLAATLQQQQGNSRGVAASGSAGTIGTAGGLVGLLGRPIVYDASPGSAMALELAMDVLSRQAAPELRALNGSSSYGSGLTAVQATGTSLHSLQSSNGVKPSASVLVRQLLSMGLVLPAARLTRTAGGVRAVDVPPAAFLAVAAATGDAGAFAAVYRVMRPHLIATWPDYESARAHFWAGRGDGTGPRA